MQENNLLIKLNNYNHDNFKDFIFDFFNNKSMMMAGQEGKHPYVLLHSIYKKLNPNSQIIFQDAILFHLGLIANELKSRWTEDASDEFFLLISRVFRNSPRRKDPVDYLIHIIRNRFDLMQLPVNLHERAIQVLLGIEYRAPVDFWYEIFTLDQERYAGFAISGLARANLNKAFEFIKVEGKNKIVTKAFFSRIAWLVEKYGSEKLEKYFKLIHYFIHKDCRDEFRYLAYKSGINLESELFQTFSSEEINDLANQLEIDIKSLESNDFNHRISLEGELRQKANLDISYTSFDSELIGCVSKIIQYKPISLNEEYRSKIIKFGQHILNESTYSMEEHNQILYDLYAIEVTGVDIKDEFNSILYQEVVNHDNRNK